MYRRADGQWCEVRRVQAVPPRQTGRLARCAAVARSAACRWLRSSLRVVREVVGAPDYERYLEHHARCHPGSAPLDRRGYYAEFVTRRFGPGPTRCC